MNNKLAMIHQAHLLFEDIMKQDYQQEINKHEQIDHIMNSLNPISSLREFSGQKHPLEAS